MENEKKIIWILNIVVVPLVLDIGCHSTFFFLINIKTYLKFKLTNYNGLTMHLKKLIIYLLKYCLTKYLSIAQNKTIRKYDFYTNDV